MNENEAILNALRAEGGDSFGYCVSEAERGGDDHAEETERPQGLLQVCLVFLEE